MTTGYRLAYLLRLTPWEKAGAGFAGQLPSLVADAEVGGPPYGSALDIGCGTGDHVIDLARRGWSVTGIDAVGSAVAKARTKITAAGVDARVVEGDVTRMSGAVGNGYRLLLDIGCFHGLDQAQRADYAREATAVSDTGAVLVMMAFGPGRRGPLPRGVSRTEVERTFDRWQLTGDDPADTTHMPGPLRKSDPRWYHLVRS